MKKFVIALVFAGILMGLNVVSFGEQVTGGGNLLSLNVLSGPTDITCGDSIINITKDEMGIGFGSSILNIQNASYDTKYAIIANLNTDKGDLKKVCYTYVKTGHFNDINLSQEDFKQILKTNQDVNNSATYFKDNLNRYFIKLADTKDGSVEYSAIIFFRSGVGIIASEYTAGPSETEQLAEFIKKVNMIKATDGNRYQDYKKGDLVNDKGIKDFLTSFYADDISEEKEKTAAGGLDFNGSDTEKKSVKDINVIEELKKSMADSKDKDKAVDSVKAQDNTKEEEVAKVSASEGGRKRFTSLLIIGIILVLLGCIKGYMQRGKKDSANIKDTGDFELEHIAEIRKVILDKKDSERVPRPMEKSAYETNGLDCEISEEKVLTGVVNKN